MPEFSLTPHTPSPIPAAGQPRVKGILWKQGGGRSFFGKKNWKKRYCVIINDNFYYYEDRQTYIKSQKYLKKPYRLQDCDVSVTEEAETSRDIQKHKSKSRKDSDSQTAFYFTIQPRNSEMRALHLRAATLAERDDWVRNIREIEADHSDLATNNSTDALVNSDVERGDRPGSYYSNRFKTKAEELYLASQNLRQHAELRRSGKVSTVIDLLQVLSVCTVCISHHKMHITTHYSIGYGMKRVHRRH